MSPVRFKARYQNYLACSRPARTFNRGFGKRAQLLKSMDEAFTLLSSPAAKAFDLALNRRKTPHPMATASSAVAVYSPGD